MCPPEDEKPCPIQQVQARVDAAIDWVVDRIASFGAALRKAAPGIGKDIAVDAALSAVPIVGEVRGGRRVIAVAEATGEFLSENRHVRGILEARKDFSRIGATADEVTAAIAESSGWQGVAEGAVAGGQLRIGTGTVRYTLKNLGKETVVNAWIP